MLEEICGEGWNHDSDYEHGKGLIRARLRNTHTMALAFPLCLLPSSRTEACGTTYLPLATPLPLGRGLQSSNRVR